MKNSSHTSSISDVDVSFMVEERRGKGRDGEEEDYSRVKREEGKAGMERRRTTVE